jgi:hypothetical protein
MFGLASIYLECLAFVGLMKYILKLSSVHAYAFDIQVSPSLCEAMVISLCDLRNFKSSFI